MIDVFVMLSVASDRLASVTFPQWQSICLFYMYFQLFWSAFLSGTSAFELNKDIDWKLLACCNNRIYANSFFSSIFFLWKSLWDLVFRLALIFIYSVKRYLYVFLIYLLLLFSLLNKHVLFVFLNLSPLRIIDFITLFGVKCLKRREKITSDTSFKIVNILTWMKAESRKGVQLAWNVSEVTLSIELTVIFKCEIMRHVVNILLQILLKFVK